MEASRRFVRLFVKVSSLPLSPLPGGDGGPSH